VASPAILIGSASKLTLDNCALVLLLLEVQRQAPGASRVHTPTPKGTVGKAYKCSYEGSKVMVFLNVTGADVAYATGKQR
jgi:hypothetical protein